MILGNVYAPTGGLYGIAKRKEFFNDVSNVLDNYPQDVPIILGGDFNCVLDPSDRSSPVTYVEKTAYNLKAVLSSYALEDIWRVQNPSSKEFIFSSSRSSFSRIDKFYTSRNFRDTFNKPRIVKLNTNSFLLQPEKNEMNISYHIDNKTKKSCDSISTKPKTKKI